MDHSVGVCVCVHVFVGVRVDCDARVRACVPANFAQFVSAPAELGTQAGGRRK